MQRDRACDAATRGVEHLRRRVDAEKGTLYVDEVAGVVGLVALIGIAVLGAALMVLSWLTATAPVSSGISCPEFEACGRTADESEAVLVDDDWISGPKLTIADR
jgi:hypothetical protein